MIALVSILCTQPTAWAAGPRTELWTRGEVEFDLDGPWKLSLGQSLRMRLDKPQVQKWLTDIGGRFKATAALRVGAGYRIGADDLAEAPSLTHRIHLDATARHDIDRFRVALRGRYQVTLPAAGQAAMQEARARAQASWAFTPRVRVSVAAEPFLALRSPVVLEQMRMQLGMRLDLSDHTQLNVWGRADLPMGDEEASQTQILGLGLTIQLSPHRSAQQ